MPLHRPRAHPLLRRRRSAPAPGQGPPEALTLTSGPVPGLPLEVAPRPRSIGLTQHETVEQLAVLARLAEALLSSGSPVHDVVRSVLRAARGAQLRGVQVDITYTAVTVCAVGQYGVPLTALRVIRSRTVGYARLAHLYALARAAGDGMPRQRVATRLAEVLAAPDERPALARLAAWPLMAAAVAVLSGAGPVLALAAALASLVVVGVRQACEHVSLPPFFTQAAGAATAAVVAVALLALPQDTPGVGAIAPAIVVGPGIVVLLAGLSLVESGQDAIAGYYVTAGARLFEAIVMTSGIVVGIAAVLSLARQVGTAVSLQAAPASPAIVVGGVAAAVASAAQALSRDAGRRAIALSGGVGAAAWLAQRASAGLGFGALMSVGVAALVVGALAQGLGPRQFSPPVVLSTCGIVPMLPGLAIYRGIASLVAGETALGSRGTHRCDRHGPGPGRRLDAGHVDDGLAPHAAVGRGGGAPHPLSVARPCGRRVRPPTARGRSAAVGGGGRQETGWCSSCSSED